jgi:hypothetical protein
MAEHQALWSAVDADYKRNAAIMWTKLLDQWWDAYVDLGVEPPHDEWHRYNDHKKWLAECR